MGFISFYWVVPILIGFYSALLDFVGSRRVFTGFYLVS